MRLLKFSLHFDKSSRRSAAAQAARQRRCAADRRPAAPRQYTALLGGDTCKPIDHAKQIDQCANDALLKLFGDKRLVIFKSPQLLFQNGF
jgi:hypothetical protein